ncbi:hypothetical protein LGM57_10690 [Burkholderia cepacia]|uniref:hypothetical protein n=1 Tax=Burkholderia cepacia TaxID=292 RepID=UPI001CF48C45|nr:hypothetical protein [Burkholderia cepacia]MCA7976787.1 hypothetical protein [Burkholderia cepacia]
MKSFILIVAGMAAFVAFLGWVFSGPSSAEVDATHDAQCIRWGAKRGSPEYVQCRAILQVNYQREENDDSNAAVAGAAMGMAAAAAGARR